MNEDQHTVVEATAAVAGDAPGAPPERAILIVYDQAPGARTRLVDLPDGAEVVFGRSRGVTVQVESDTVSRTHARIFRSRDEIRVEDLESRNGTRVNGEKILGSVRLHSGDEIGIGTATAVLSVTTSMTRRAPVGSTSYLEERLAAEADRALRYHRTFALVMLRFDGEETVIDGAVEQIAAQLRPMDVLAEYGPDEYAVIIPEANAVEAAQAAARLRGQARSAGLVSVQVGLALFPEHATGSGELLSRARSALNEARRARTEEVVTAPQDQAALGPSGVVVADTQMKRVYSLVQKVADHPITVLITGETGVGKEVVAETLHREGSRKDRDFVRLNCASIPETLLESELFGHERGAFTGADRRKIGYFEAADGGTIFLDEIGEISAGIQAKLLRVLEERRFTRVGGVQEIEVDVRVVCATNKDLEEEVRKSAFREDLFFRVTAFTIVVPPLRDRPTEIQLLAAHFADQAARDMRIAAPRFTPEAVAALRSYAWPGNVRELRNAIERAVVLHTGGRIEETDLPDRIRQNGGLVAARDRVVAIGNGVDMRDQIAEVERAAIIAALEECGGNQTRAAQKLGVSRRSLIYKLEKYGLKPRPGGRSREV